VENIYPGIADTHLLFRPDFWGHETTVPGVRAAYHQFFQENPSVEKLTSMVFDSNVASVLGLARKLGGEKAGKRSAVTKKSGRWVDGVFINLFRGAFYAVDGCGVVDLVSLAGGGGVAGREMAPESDVAAEG
jgi:RimJ/RimL family protein N-acetyltransferase